MWHRDKQGLECFYRAGLNGRRTVRQGTWIGCTSTETYIHISSLYKVIDEAYTHANRTLLHLLLRDQQLIPRLHSLKRYFFLSQSSFLTHLLDLSHSELRKSARSASIVKLQSLLDLALNTDVQGEDAMFREDVKVTMASSGLYEWLLNVVNVSGEIDEGSGADGHGHTHEESKKDKDDKKQILGISIFYITMRRTLNYDAYSYRRINTRLHRQLPSLTGHFTQDHPPISVDFSLPSASQARRTSTIDYVDRT